MNEEENEQSTLSVRQVNLQGPTLASSTGVRYVTVTERPTWILDIMDVTRQIDTRSSAQGYTESPPPALRLQKTPPSH